MSKLPPSKHQNLKKSPLSGDRKLKLSHTAEFPKIEKAVIRAVREYGEALKKLAKED